MSGPREFSQLTEDPARTRQQEAGEFRFLSLPLELRRKVYRHYFISTYHGLNDLYRLVQRDTHCNIYCLRECRIDILTVNRQLYSEARDVLYSDTTCHIGFSSSHRTKIPAIASGVSLRAFRSRPEFRLIQNITVGIMFVCKSEDYCRRLELNRRLLEIICEHYSRRRTCEHSSCCGMIGLSMVSGRRSVIV